MEIRKIFALQRKNIRKDLLSLSGNARDKKSSRHRTAIVNLATQAVDRNGKPAEICQFLVAIFWHRKTVKKSDQKTDWASARVDGHRGLDGSTRQEPPKSIREEAAMEDKEIIIGRAEEPVSFRVHRPRETSPRR
jgi:hypothetical protein